MVQKFTDDDRLKLLDHLIGKHTETLDRARCIAAAGRTANEVLPAVSTAGKLEAELIELQTARESVTGETDA